MSDRGALAGRIVIRLFRSWAASRQTAMPELGRMNELAAGLGLSQTIVPQCAHLFELVEAHLGRPLCAECCCSPHLSTDERALVGLLLVNGAAERSQTAPCPCDAIRAAALRLRETVASRGASDRPRDASQTFADASVAMAASPPEVALGI